MLCSIRSRVDLYLVSHHGFQSAINRPQDAGYTPVRVMYCQSSSCLTLCENKYYVQVSFYAKK